ncbi:MAG TPA: Smr/MutS family protein, partial [Methylomirabilota bacterium]|nr:Smr/MutS family protein [Methylomirabilota bacterium]
RLQPTFRLVYDRPGQSYALAIGARLGLPAHLIERAESHRSAQRRQLEALLQRLEERDRIQAEHAQAVERREVESATLLSRAEARLEAATRQAAELTARAKADAQRLLTEIRRSVNAEWDRLKREDKTRESLEQSRKRLVEAARGVEGPVETFDTGGRGAAAGDRVEVPHLGLKGDVLTVDGGTATVQAGAVTVKVPAQALRVVGRADSGKITPEGRSPLPHRGRGQGEGGRSEAGVVPNELRLIGRTTDEARDLLEKYLDDAFLAGLPSVRVIHGKGTGALRRAVEELLASHPLIISHRPGELHEGGAGATVAVLGQA